MCCIRVFVFAVCYLRAAEAFNVRDVLSHTLHYRIHDYVEQIALVNVLPDALKAYPLVVVLSVDTLTSTLALALALALTLTLTLTYSHPHMHSHSHSHIHMQAHHRNHTQ